MARFTFGAESAQRRMYRGDAKDDIRAGFVQYAQLDEETDDIGSNLWVRKSDKGMVGALAVKDLCGNRHHLVTRTSQPTLSAREPGSHVEPNLLEAVGTDFLKQGKQLQACKVVVSLLDSPCKKCTKSLEIWCSICASRIAAKGGRSCYFVFNFERIYSGSQDGFADGQWADGVEAWKAYDAVTLAAGTTNFIKRPDGGLRKYNVVNFRLIPPDGGIAKLPHTEPAKRV